MTDSSDIDVMVEVDPDKVDTDFFELSVFLQEQFGRSVDVIDTDYIDPLIKPALIRDAKLVW